MMNFARVGQERPTWRFTLRQSRKQGGRAAGGMGGGCRSSPARPALL